jgi:tetratricopeptide (TPR) repeat protein
MKAAEAIADRAGRDDALEASLLASRIPLNALLGFADRNPALHDQEVAVLTRLYGDRDPRVARAFSDRGLTHYLLGKLDPALVDVQQAIALAAAVAGPGNPHLARDYIYLGAVQHARGQLKESRDAYDRARALQVDGPLELALAQYTLAKSLRGAGRDASRAREMAEQTRDELRKMPTLNKELAAVESWLIEGSGQNAAPSP